MSQKTHLPSFLPPPFFLLLLPVHNFNFIDFANSVFYFPGFPGVETEEPGGEGTATPPAAQHARSLQTERFSFHFRLSVAIARIDWQGEAQRQRKWARNVACDSSCLACEAWGPSLALK